MTMSKKGMVRRQHPQGKEMDLQPREVMVQSQRHLELSLKKKSISGVCYKIWQAMQMIIRGEIYSRKRCQRGNFDNNSKAREP